MTVTVQDGAAIVAGYDWTATINMTATIAPFPAGVELTAHVRKKVKDKTPLTTLTTGNQALARIDDNNLSVTVPGVDSEAWNEGSVFIDFVRTDTDPDTYVGFRLEVPVETPVTRGLT